MPSREKTRKLRQKLRKRRYNPWCRAYWNLDLLDYTPGYNAEQLVNHTATRIMKEEKDA